MSHVGMAKESLGRFQGSSIGEQATVIIAVATLIGVIIAGVVEARGAAEWRAANKEAAETARHRGALAFLHDTHKALAAYRRATELDPENAKVWNGLGHLLVRTGALDKAAAAYRTVASLGQATNDR